MKRAVAEIGIGRRLAPGFAQARDWRRRQSGKQIFVLRKRQRRVAPRRRQARRADRARVFGASLIAIAGGGEIIEQREHACRHIESDRIAGAARRAGIIRHQHGDPPLSCAAAPADGRSAAMRSATIATRSGFGPACQRREGKSLVRRQRVLERDRAGKDAAIKLGQHDMHREIGGAEPARAVAPGGAPRRRADDLQHRNAGSVERRRLAAVCRRPRMRSW